MTHYEVSFKLQHDHCPYNQFSKTHPSVVISHWCNWSKDVLEISHRDIQNDGVIKKEVQKLTGSLGAKIIRRSFARASVQVVFMHCACDSIPPPTLPVIEKRNCLELQPAVYSDGWEWYRVIAFSDSDLKKLFKDLDKHCSTIEVISRRSISDESVRDTFLLSTASIFGTLTGKQIRALMTALDNGYYRLPRNATAGDIAKLMGVPRTSFVDHLRKAENKVLQAVGPYLRLKPSEI
jgi:predicted DNA binding protein